MMGWRDSGWKRRADLAAGLVLGGIFILATVGKALDPILFVQTIRNEGLEILLSANQIALLTLAAEAALGVGLLAGIRALWLLIPTSALVGFFLFLTGRVYWEVSTGARADDGACGCFGVLFERTAAQAFWQDLFLLTVPLAVLWWAGRWRRSEGFPFYRTAAMALGAAATVVLTIQLVGMPPDVSRLDSAQAGLLHAGPPMSLWEAEAPLQTAVFESGRELQLFVVSPELENPVVLDLGRGRLFRLEGAAVEELEDGSARLLGNPVWTDAGEFEMEADGIRFEIDGRLLQLKSADPAP
jgi:hypothetical protein